MSEQHETRFGCDACDWIGVESGIVKFEDPDSSVLNFWNICPRCRTAESFTNLCNECDAEGTVGTPTPDGYKRLCYTHYKLLADPNPPGPA